VRSESAADIGGGAGTIQTHPGAPCTEAKRLTGVVTIICSKMVRFAYQFKLRSTLLRSSSYYIIIMIIQMHECGDRAGSRCAGAGVRKGEFVCRACVICGQGVSDWKDIVCFGVCGSFGQRRLFSRWAAAFISQKKSIVPIRSSSYHAKLRVGRTYSVCTCLTSGRWLPALFFSKRLSAIYAGYAHYHVNEFISILMSCQSKYCIVREQCATLVLGAFGSSCRKLLIATLNFELFFILAPFVKKEYACLIRQSILV
jgi:hypothetical protein